MNLLRLTYELEDEWHGQLHVCAVAHGFAGRSAAWFNRDALTAFSHALGEYPLPSHAPVKILGGGGALAAGWYSQEHVGLTIARASITGKLLVCVDLANEPAVGAGTTIQRRAFLRFLTEYASVDQFRSELGPMLNGGTEALLRGTEA